MNMVEYTDYFLSLLRILVTNSKNEHWENLESILCYLWESDKEGALICISKGEVFQI